MRMLGKVAWEPRRYPKRNWNADNQLGLKDWKSRLLTDTAASAKIFAGEIRGFFDSQLNLPDKPWHGQPIEWTAKKIPQTEIAGSGPEIIAERDYQGCKQRVNICFSRLTYNLSFSKWYQMYFVHLLILSQRFVSVIGVTWWYQSVSFLGCLNSTHIHFSTLQSFLPKYLWVWLMLDNLSSLILSVNMECFFY